MIAALVDVRAYHLHTGFTDRIVQTMKANDTNLMLPAQQVSIDVLIEKYAKGGETTIEDVRRRVARALAVVESDPDR